MNIPIFIPNYWADYELIDSGEGMKLERFDRYAIVRPDPRALWEKHASADQWAAADAAFNPQINAWDTKNPTPPNWHVSHNDIALTLKPTSFKNIGVFPEQAVNWDWLTHVVNNKSLKVLNLFAYTGAASIAATQAGANVTHVDSQKAVITWAKENAIASGLSKNAIRWIEEDATKFVAREARRGQQYDGIIMDPPRFGRGAKGEVWKLHDDLPRLLSACKEILSPTPTFFLVNAYTADISALVLKHLLDDMFNGTGALEAGELALKESVGKRLVPHGIFARWSTR